MSNQDSDSTLIRGQQDKDTPEHIALDETHAPTDASDTDAESRKARESAKSGVAPNGREQMASIFEQNGGTEGETVVKPDHASAQDDADGGLARKGRSLLGD